MLNNPAVIQKLEQVILNKNSIECIDSISLNKSRTSTFPPTSSAKTNYRNLPQKVQKNSPSVKFEPQSSPWRNYTPLRTHRR